jgi:hypothetical protein
MAAYYGILSNGYEQGVNKNGGIYGGSEVCIRCIEKFYTPPAHGRENMP